MHVAVLRNDQSSENHNMHLFPSPCQGTIFVNDSFIAQHFVTLYIYLAPLGQSIGLINTM